MAGPTSNERSDIMKLMQQSINYLVPLASAEDGSAGSPFQGFSASLLKRSQWIRTILSRCPPTITELYRQSPRTLQLRLVGLQSYRILFLLDCDLHRLSVKPIDPFWVVLADSATKGCAEDWRAKQAISVEVITLPDGCEEPSLPTWQSVRHHCDAVLTLVQTSLS